MKAYYYANAGLFRSHTRQQITTNKICMYVHDDDVYDSVYSRIPILGGNKLI